MLESLSFIRSKEHWGAAFRFGFLRVPEEDFARIAAAMGRDFAPSGTSQPRARRALDVERRWRRAIVGARRNPRGGDDGRTW